MPGHAGNFLTRLFSLSPETIPQVPIDVLKKSVIETGQVPVIKDRADYYSFKKHTQHASWQEFHRAWPDFYQQNLFEYFNELYSMPFSHVVYSIHPHEFEIRHKEILQTDYVFYYVDTDAQLLPWINDSQCRLKFEYRPTYDIELSKFTQFKEKYNMTAINLLQMVSTIDTFVSEYLKITTHMALTPVIDSAKKLYCDWHAVRNPKLC